MSQSSSDQPNLNLEKTNQRDYSLTIFFICASLIMAIAGSIGFFATSRLLQLPKAESCPKVFWPLASASVRLYCAQSLTQEKTVSGWVEAITMVDVLPKTHPLRPEVDRNINIWIKSILAQGEALFQSGKIDEALAIADQVPKQISAYKLVQEQKATWQSIWQEAETKEKRIEDYISHRDWRQAFREAAQLTSLDNQYWSTVRYEANLNQIQAARSESNKLDSAYALLDTGEADNLLDAIADAQRIESSSSAYLEAQELIDTAKNNLIKLIQSKVESRDWQGLEAILGKIPLEADWSEGVDAWYQLAEAGTTANQGTVEGIDKAIAIAETIEPKSPVYYEAQKLINRWELEVKDVASLSAARKMAQRGEIKDLEKAITEAESISPFNPRYQEAQTEISQWKRQIQIIEDQPILAKAQRLSQGKTVNAWQEAIAQASSIGPDRALYPQAQQLIRQSRYKIEITQDEPILAQAITLAELQNWTGAIAKAKEITVGRALYQEAQAKISIWQRQAKAEENFQEAQRLASTNRVDDLSRAIQLVSQIPNNTSVASASQQSVDDWSNQLLTIAQETADYDLIEAINIAKLIPRGTSVYNSARTYMEIWRRKHFSPPLYIPESEN